MLSQPLKQQGQRCSNTRADCLDQSNSDPDITLKILVKFMANPSKLSEVRNGAKDKRKSKNAYTYGIVKLSSKRTPYVKVDRRDDIDAKIRR